MKQIARIYFIIGISLKLSLLLRLLQIQTTFSRSTISRIFQVLLLFTKGSMSSFSSTCPALSLQDLPRFLPRVLFCTLKYRGRLADHSFNHPFPMQILMSKPKCSFPQPQPHDTRLSEGRTQASVVCKAPHAIPMSIQG